MRAEHLRQWLIAATRDDAPDATNWLKVVAITRDAATVSDVARNGLLNRDCTKKQMNNANTSTKKKKIQETWIVSWLAKGATDYSFDDVHGGCTGNQKTKQL